MYGEIYRLPSVFNTTAALHIGCYVIIKFLHTLPNEQCMQEGGKVQIKSAEENTGYVLKSGDC